MFWGRTTTILVKSIACLLCFIWGNSLLPGSVSGRISDAVKELLALTGYIRGGCSPVGMKKKYPTFIDEVCLLFEEIAVSAGERGHQMILPPEDLVRLTDAKLVDIIV